MRKILTISRQFGSGGRELGRMLGQELGLPVIDRYALQQLAKRNGLDASRLLHESETGVVPAILNSRPKNTEPLLAVARILKETAQKEDCIFVGFGAAEILQDFHPFSLFVCGSLESRMDTVRKRENTTESDKALARRIQETDKGRASVHMMLAGTGWGDIANYDMVINTTDTDLADIVPGLAEYVRGWWEGHDGHPTV